MTPPRRAAQTLWVKIHINRGGQSLGTFEPDDVRAGYRDGKFLAADLAWRDGMAEWRPLGDVIDEIAPGSIEGAPPLAPALKQDGPAWERRDQLGFLKALLETIRAVLLEPSATFSSMRPFGGFWGPLMFALIVGMVGVVASVFYQVAWTSLGMLPQGDKEAAAATAILGSGFAMIIVVVFMPVLLTAGMFISSGLVHLALMIVGGARKPFESTFRVICYAAGATSVLQLLPIIGATLASIWALVAEIIGLSEVHGIGKGKATIAVLLPVIVCCGLAILIAAAAIGLGVAATAAAATSGGAPPAPVTP